MARAHTSYKEVSDKPTTNTSVETRAAILQSLSHELGVLDQQRELCTKAHAYVRIWEQIRHISWVAVRTINGGWD